MSRVLSRHSTCADAQARSPASRRQDQWAAVPHSQPSTGRSPVGFWVRPHAPIASFQPSILRPCVPPPRPPYSRAAVLAAPIASFQPSSRACGAPPRPPYSRAVVFAAPIASFQPSSRACGAPPRPPYSRTVVFAVPIASFQPSSRACGAPPRPPYSRAAVLAVPIASCQPSSRACGALRPPHSRAAVLACGGEWRTHQCSRARPLRKRAATRGHAGAIAPATADSRYPHSHDIGPQRRLCRHPRQEWSRSSPFDNVKLNMKHATKKRRR